MKLAIVIPSVIAIILIVAVLLLPKAAFQRTPRKPLLPTTGKPQSQSSRTFLQRHLAVLRAWQKPNVPTPPANSSQAAQESHVVEMTHIPAPTAPAPVYQPHQKPMTYKEFVKRQRMRDPCADEYHRHVRESWIPTPPKRTYWKQVGEDMEARRTGWDKLKVTLGY